MKTDVFIAVSKSMVTYWSSTLSSVDMLGNYHNRDLFYVQWVSTASLSFRTISKVLSFSLFFLIFTLIKFLVNRFLFATLDGETSLSNLLQLIINCPLLSLLSALLQPSGNKCNLGHDNLTELKYFCSVSAMAYFYKY